MTEEDHFGGKPEWLPRAKRISGLPVLMKDFVISERQLDFAVSLGADAVLLIVRALSDEELVGARQRRPRARPRDRRRGRTKRGRSRRAWTRGPTSSASTPATSRRFATDFDALEESPRAFRRGPCAWPRAGSRTGRTWLRLQAAGYEAFLVGETLLRDEDPEEALRDLKR